MPSIDRKIEDVLETIKVAKERGRKCCLLIGAGCSVKAGVPLASGFVDIIREMRSAAYARADDPKNYAQCMAELSLSERRDLIGKYVDKARINWGHVAIAQLINHGFVDRVLTTNFDPLVVRACAMVGHFPAVYDFAASQILKPADISGDAIFYLHGQRNGFVLMNTKAECDDHSEKLAPLFRDAGQGRVWIVVGYSGENDPVFEHLANVQNFDDALYWIGYKDNEPAKHVRERLLTGEKYAFHVKGFDADDFFVTVAQKLKCFPPRLISEPFSHLDDQFKQFTEYNAPQQDQGTDITERARKMVRSAITEFEKSPKQRVSSLTNTAMPVSDLQVVKEFMAGNYAKIVEHYPAGRAVPAEFRDEISLSYNRLGIAFSDQAKQKSGAEADRLFAQAGENYAEALGIKPDMHEALYNWGLALYYQALQKSDAEADRLFAQAGEKYAEALRIKPDMHEALYNLGLALYAQAQQEPGAEADRLFAQAGEKYAEALRIKPDKHDAFYNWGLALYDQAQQKSGAEADRLFAQAGEKYAEALRIKPDKHDAFNNWGLALYDQAQQKSGAEADRLFAQAGEKYAEALRIKPDKHDAFYNWGLALYDQAQQKSGAEADRLFAQAGEKYAEALRIKPDKHDALYNWGIALTDQAQQKSGAEADRLFAQAGEKYAEALRIKPDMDDALYNWGLALYAQAQQKSDAEAERLYTQAGEKYAEALRIKPDKHEALYNWGNALSAQAKQKSDADADRLFAQAGENYKEALRIKPDIHEAFNAWGTALAAQAKQKSGAEANEILAIAFEKCMRSEELKPGGAAYNLACISALQHKSDDCKRWLEKSLAHGLLPSKQQVLADNDLVSVRDLDWFKSLIQSLPE